MKKLISSIAMALLLSCVGVRADNGNVAGHYWFDFGKSRNFTPGNFEIDTDGLPEGFHVLNAYVESNGITSSVASKWFVKTPRMDSGTPCKAIVYIDGTPRTDCAVTPSGNVLAFDIDCSDLPIGVHSISACMVTPDGVSSNFREGFFYRCPIGAELASFSGYYILDGVKKGVINMEKAGGVCHLDIDVSSLSSGLHSITVFLASPFGIATTPQTSWFIKIPKQGEGVVAYEYWLNDNYGKVTAAKLDKTANPFGLTSLIDVDIEPFCSARYTFAIEDGTPMVYGKNDFQIRFIDGDGRMTSANGSYTDMRTGMAIKDIVPIVREERNHIDELAENTIQWYKFTGEIGDSISVRLDRGGMLDLYSPSAKTVISSRGVDATTYNSHILDENGVYYLAVHDVAFDNRFNVGVDFMHVSKFDMISNSPRKSSGGCDVFIDVIGNGFDCLESISLVGNESSVPAKDFAVKDNYHLSAQFDLKSNKLVTGDYSLVATFVNKDSGEKETVVREKALTIEPTEPSDIRVRIHTPFTPGTPYEVTIEVTNYSRTPCWGIPLNFAVRRSQKGMAISFKDFYPYSHPELASLTQIFVQTNNLLGTGEPGYFFPTVIPYIGAYETITLTLGFRSDPMEKIRMYAWAGKPWSEEFEEILDENFDLNEIVHLKDSNLFTARTLCYLYALYCENNGESRVPQGLSRARMKDLDTMIDLAGHNADIAQATGMALGGLYNGMRLHNLNATLDAYGVDLSDETFGSLADYQNSLKQGMPTPESIIATAVGHGELYDLANEMANNCATSANPMPDPHDFICYQSGDPNDIKGYESPSGSKYLGYKVKSIDYTIEFENDPKIANASAMTVSIENRLDGSIFDLESFTPLSMQIGDKVVDLPSEHKFIKTVDMRPEINAIAELNFKYDPSTGYAKWVIRSLDPLTMEETKYMTDGILPVNDESGRGTGYLRYSINLASNLSDGTEISNSAQIVFDNNDPIATPVWTNITDYVLPTATVEEATTDDGLVYKFKFNGSDTGSGIWYYDLYVKEDGDKDWIPVKTHIEDNEFEHTFERPLNGAIFSIVATDLAGNCQNDDIAKVLVGDADNNGVVDANDVVVMRNYYLGTIDWINRQASDVNSDGMIDAQDALSTRIIYLDTAILSKHRSQKRRKQ